MLVLLESCHSVRSLLFPNRLVQQHSLPLVVLDYSLQYDSCSLIDMRRKLLLKTETPLSVSIGRQRDRRGL